jgi:hypothetical protein
MICDVVGRASTAHTGKLLLGHATLLITRLAWGILVARIIDGMLLLDTLGSSFVGRLDSPRLLSPFFTNLSGDVIVLHTWICLLQDGVTIFPVQDEGVRWTWYCRLASSRARLSSWFAIRCRCCRAARTGGLLGAGERPGRFSCLDKGRDATDAEQQ